jgi:transketolase
VVGDLGHGVIEDFASRFPDQFVNAGVAEQNMTGLAAGLALKGKTVFTYSIANFPSLRALEQIRNDILHHDLPVTIVSVGTGFGYGVLGYSHHAVEDLSIMRALPGLRVLSPSTDKEVIEAVDLILAKPQPTYLRLDKASQDESDFQYAPSGYFDGSSVEGGTLVLALGSMRGPVSEAFGLMEESEKKLFTLGHVWRVKPLELPPLDLRTFSRIYTVEEHVLPGGFGSAVLEHLEFGPHIQKVKRIGIPDGKNHVVGSQVFLREQCGLDARSLLAKFRH